MQRFPNEPSFQRPTGYRSPYGFGRRAFLFRTTLEQEAVVNDTFIIEFKLTTGGMQSFRPLDLANLQPVAPIQEEYGPSTSSEASTSSQEGADSSTSSEASTSSQEGQNSSTSSDEWEEGYGLNDLYPE